MVSGLADYSNSPTKELADSLTHLLKREQRINRDLREENARLTAQNETLREANRQLRELIERIVTHEHVQ